MNTITHNGIHIIESEAYTIIQIPKQRAMPTVQTDDIRFDEFVGMLEDDREAFGKTGDQGVPSIK
jgi:hypothetical protein